jgi:hypothetical protein
MIRVHEAAMGRLLPKALAKGGVLVLATKQLFNLPEKRCSQ